MMSVGINNSSGAPEIPMERYRRRSVDRRISIVENIHSIIIALREGAPKGARE